MVTKSPHHVTDGLLSLCMCLLSHGQVYKEMQRGLKFRWTVVITIHLQTLLGYLDAYTAFCTVCPYARSYL